MDSMGKAKVEGTSNVVVMAKAWAPHHSWQMEYITMENSRDTVGAVDEGQNQHQAMRASVCVCGLPKPSPVSHTSAFV